MCTPVQLLFMSWLLCILLLRFRCVDSLILAIPLAVAFTSCSCLACYCKYSYTSHGFYASCGHAFVTWTPSSLHYRLHLLLLVPRVWRAAVTTAAIFNIGQLPLCVVIIWPCYDHKCCHQHNRAGKHHGAGQYLGSQLWPYAVKRRHGLYYSFNAFHACCVKVWLHARRVLHTQSRMAMLSQGVDTGCLKHSRLKEM